MHAILGTKRLKVGGKNKDSSGAKLDFKVLESWEKKKHKGPRGTRRSSPKLYIKYTSILLA